MCNPKERIHQPGTKNKSKEKAQKHKSSTIRSRRQTNRLHAQTVALIT